MRKKEIRKNESRWERQKGNNGRWLIDQLKNETNNQSGDKGTQESRS